MENLFKLFYESTGICTDTRNIKKGSLYISLKGSNFNGNHFAEEAINQGAKYAIVDEYDISNQRNIYYVTNSLIFLQKLANFHRNKFNIPVIGITGSNGKTTSKELINSVLSQKYKTLYTKGNLNNHIGVPLTILSLNETHEVAIIEMGANKPGDIKELVDIAQPNFAMITNIGKAHLEGFKNLDGVIKTKTELYDFIRTKNGNIVYNLNDEIISLQCRNYSHLFSYGSDKKANVSGQLIELNPFVNLTWEFEKYQSPIIQTNLVGSYNFNNYLGAICFGIIFNVPFDKINEAISSYTPSNNRSQVLKTKSNILIIDCYNANPSSMYYALESFIRYSQENKIVILGDMLELGPESIQEHSNILKLCEKNNLSFLTVGSIYKEINPNGFNHVSDLEKYLIDYPLENSSILLKGSRGISLEKIIYLL